MALFVAMTSAVWLADPATGLSIDWSRLVGPIYSTGLVGLIIIMLILERGIVTKKSMDRMAVSHHNEIDAKDEIIATQQVDIAQLKQANAELQKLTSDKLIPALVQATEVSRAYVAELSRRGGLGGS